MDLIANFFRSNWRVIWNEDWRTTLNFMRKCVVLRMEQTHVVPKYPWTILVYGIVIIVYLILPTIFLGPVVENEKLNKNMVPLFSGSKTSEIRKIDYGTEIDKCMGFFIAVGDYTKDGKNRQSSQYL